MKHSSNKVLSSRMRLQNTPIASLQRGKFSHPNECPGYNNKLSDVEAPILQEF